jgi:hypothetical protein
LRRKREIVREIKDLLRTKQLPVWQEKTGNREATLYRRLTEIDGLLEDEK